MEDEGMKITVVGMVLIIATVVVVALVVGALNQNDDSRPRQNQSGGQE